MRVDNESIQKLSLYRAMLRIRLVEERIVALYPEQEMRCPTHLSIGQEAVATGVCAHLNPDDYAISTHRSHAHYLAKGGSLKAMMAELYGKADGCAKGKGGSMHLIDQSVGFLGCVPIVGSTVPIGVGACFGKKIQGRSKLVVIFIGDGAVETGVFHESANFSSLHRLPIIFICENNLYSVNTPLSERQPSNHSMLDLARGHAIEAAECDGQDVEAVSEIAGSLIAKAQAGAGPFFLECKTYRWMEHVGPEYDLDLGFRPPGEYEAWTARCPVDLFRMRLLKDGTTNEDEIETIRVEIEEEIDQAIDHAKASPFPTHDQLMADVYSP